MRLASREQARKIDRLAQSEFQMSARSLMERAGYEAFLIMSAKYGQKLGGASISIICGTGNNGGDGLVVARHLTEIAKVTVWTVGEFQSQEARDQFEKTQALQVPIRKISESDDWIESDFLVDALFGIGLHRALSNELVEVVRKMNLARGVRISLDVPSGLDVDTGWDFGACMRSDLTITFGLPKPGFYLNLGIDRAKNISVADIGYPSSLVQREAASLSLFDDGLARRVLPERVSFANKSDFGRLAVVAGSNGMWGAHILSTLAGFRSGAGYVYGLSFEDPSKTVNEAPEVMHLPISKFRDHDKVDAWVVGPGLGATKEVLKKTAGLIDDLKKRGCERVVIDAEGLSGIKGEVPGTWILTPHTGELARMLGVDVSEVEGDRVRAARLASQKFGGHVLLKGSHTVLSMPNGQVSIVDSGSVALAKAGTGDVLAGLIGGLLAQELSSEVSAALGSYVHGLAADLWVRSSGSNESLTASDLLSWVPKAFGFLHSSNPVQKHI